MGAGGMGEVYRAKDTNLDRDSSHLRFYNGSRNSIIW